jgi:hypothetical protein
VDELTGFDPIHGNTSCSSRRMILMEWEGAQVATFLACHSRATVSNESTGGRQAAARRTVARC